MFMQALVSILLLLSVFLSSGCSKDTTNGNNNTNTAFFAKGADISWVSEMEANGKKFYDSTGQQQDIVTLLKSYGMNTIRLRIWVNPSAGWNNAADVLSKARRAAAAGMHILLDFHYSDSWADPGQQTKPVAWQSLNFNTLKDSLQNHTLGVLNYLKAGGISPDWVQVGNETNDGMLWPDGKASASMSNFSELVKTGYNAVKTVFPPAKVIVHISNGYDNSLFRWIFDGLKANNVNWDVIGMSLYPAVSDWQLRNDQCLVNMQDMVSRYGKEVMLVEVGMPWDQPAACRSFLADIISKTKSLTANKGLGVLYWEPECYSWQGYTLGCFDLNGRPTTAMNAFR